MAINKLNSIKLSIVVPMYNSEKYLGDALKSLLEQTFRDFELILIDDKSTDATVSIAKSYDDPRIKLYLNEVNFGAGATRNRGIDYAKGEYIAFADSDDIMFPERLAKQVAFLDAHPDVDVCGAGSHITTEQLEVLRSWKCPVSHEQIDVDMMFGCPINQSVVVMRRKSLLDSEVRYIKGNFAEDYEFWSRAVKSLRCHNLDDILMLYRSSPTQLSTGSLDKQCRDAIVIIDKLINELGVNTNGDLRMATVQYRLFHNDKTTLDRALILEYCDLCYKMWMQNNISGRYDRKIFTKKIVKAYRKAQYKLHSRIMARIISTIFKLRLR